MAIDWQQTVRQWEAVLEAVARLGGEVDELIVEPPASEAEILAAESELGRAIPSSLREVLLTYSKRFGFHWYLPDDFSLPNSLWSAKYGGSVFSLNGLVEAEQGREDIVEDAIELFDNDPRIAALWRNTFGFYDIITGDRLAIKTAEPDRSAVVYLSHDDKDEQGNKMGDDFQDFLVRWSALGCPGPESLPWAPFAAGPESAIDPHCPNALLWKRILGLKG